MFFDFSACFDMRIGNGSRIGTHSDGVCFLLFVSLRFGIDAFWDLQRI